MRRGIAILLFVLLTLGLPNGDCSAAHAPVVINEVMASNGSTIADSDGDFPDWIELYNPSDIAVDLTGYYLSDDDDNPTRWQFPQGTIEGKGYLLVWASNKDKVGDNGELHTNFAIRAAGEPVMLLAPDGETVLDYLDPLPIPRDVSYGRVRDGASEWMFFDEPTPGESNRGAEEFIFPPHPPSFSVQGGFFTAPFSLELTTNEDGVRIYYTLDGSEPEPSRQNPSSPFRVTNVYEGPLSIQSRAGDRNVFSNIPTTGLLHSWQDPWRPPVGEVFKATVVRAVAYDPKADTMSRVVTQTYFVDEDIFERYPTLPVVSLVSDYNNLFHDETGIYVPGTSHGGEIREQNFFQDWRPPAHFEFFEPGGALGFSGDYEIRTQGSTSQAAMQKGLHVTARRDLGDNRIHYPLFETARSQVKDITEFKRFILRAWGSSSARFPAFFSDAHNQTLLAEFDIEIQDYRPIILFINGEYWGPHELREANKNSWYHHFRTGIDRDDPGFDLIDGAWNQIDEGDTEHWDAMFAFLTSNDMALTENYEYIQTQIDIDNFILYMIHNVYLSKRDWPDQNEAKWRPRTEDGRWRWTQFDMDHGFNHWSRPEYDMVYHILHGDAQMGRIAHPVFVELIANEKFKIQFINTFADLMNTVFSTEYEMEHFNRMAAELDPYIPEYQARLDYLHDWEQDLQTAREVIARRRRVRTQQLIDNFDLAGTVQLTLVSDPEMGQIQINSLLLCESTPGVVHPDWWIGTYFRGVPVQITAIAAPGYRFTGWRGLDTQEAQVTLTLNRNRVLWAEFEAL